MGSKFEYLVIVLFLFNFTAKAQNDLDFRIVDSLTYGYYKSGDWNNLIKLGTEAIDHGIDYKYLRQRIGFAFFSKANYYESQKHFLKAFSFDSYDSSPLTYLYYSYLNTGQQDIALYFAGKMSQELRKSLSVKPFQIVESISAEYNFKFAGIISRSNPQYFNFGISTRLGTKVGLYQMFSNYKQQIFSNYKQPLRNQGLNEIVNDKQPEYYALVKFAITPHWMLKSAYHYLNSINSSTNNNGNLGFAGLSANFNHLNFEGDVSVLKIEQYFVKQSGIQAEIRFSHNLNMYMTSALSFLNQPDINRFIYNQKAGFRIFKKGWVEGNITIGDLTNYNDFNAMYVYNLIDPTTLRAGASFFFFSGKHISLWANYSFERKEYYEDNSYHYNQFSYLGGIKWKL